MRLLWNPAGRREFVAPGLLLAICYLQVLRWAPSTWKALLLVLVAVAWSTQLSRRLRDIGAPSWLAVLIALSIPTAALCAEVYSGWALLVTALVTLPLFILPSRAQRIA